MFCEQFHALLDHNVTASANYHQAITRLVEIAGQADSASFDDAKRECNTCLEECKRTSTALRRHRADHGC